MGDNKNLATEIKNMALALGYTNCGIIPIQDMLGYAEKLTQRIALFPDTKERFNNFYDFAYLEQKYPWAKSVVVCIHEYGHYKIPAHLQGLIAKYYLVDSRCDCNTKEYQASMLLEKFLLAQGLKTITERKFGVTALRWAAMQAGLGIVRKNNFFYTANGSWVHLEAWLIDKALELKDINTIKQCPEECTLCQKSCPTGSLCSPYIMHRSSCVSCLTTWDGWDMPNEKYKKQMGSWIFGCDACQDACPFNHKKWIELDTFPHLSAIASKISLEKIVLMDYNTLRDIIQPKFWYIEKNGIWKWKTNALNAMLNSGNHEYHQYFVYACNDEQEQVRAMAQWALENEHNYFK